MWYVQKELTCFGEDGTSVTNALLWCIVKEISDGSHLIIILHDIMNNDEVLPYSFHTFSHRHLH